MKLALGTAQFGSAYGVANSSGKVPFNEAQRILDFARGAGIDVLDTAVGYGDCESVLGSLKVSGWRLITKIPPLDDSAINVESWVTAHVNASMQRMGVDSLYGVFLHRSEDILNDRGSQYVRALLQLRDSGRVTHVGYSIYSPAILGELTSRLWPDIVQTPFNVFDQRIKNSGWLDKLTSGGTMVHARSVFLQGLLLMHESGRPAYFDSWKAMLSNWLKVVAAEGGSPLEIALNFALQEKMLDRVVVGVDSLAQIEQIVAAVKDVAIPDLSGFACDDVRLIEPFRWKVQ